MWLGGKGHQQTAWCRLVANIC